MTEERKALYAFTAVLASLTVMRLIALFTSDINLGPDETQYWFWAQTPDFGYFSKPPFIAWVIAITTGLFGDSEWAVRLAAPFFHAGTAFMLYMSAAHLTRKNALPWTGFWAGALWLTAPGIMLSSLIISTDTPMLFFWSAALLCFLKLSDPDTPVRRPYLWAVLLGVSLGLAMLAKYAAIYFPIGAVLAVFLTRAKLQARYAILATVIALLIIAPNLLWNAQNGFQTVSHTAANANWSGALFQPLALLAFWGGQFAVFGPLTLILLIIAIVALAKRRPNRETPDWNGLTLLALTAPPFIIVSIQAFISRAHANWAAAAFPAAAVFLAIWAVRAGRTRWLAIAAGVNLVIGFALTIGSTNFALVDALGASDAVKRVRGWPEQGDDIARRAHPYRIIMADDREIIGALVYYTRQTGKPIVALNSNHRIEHHYEAFHPVDPNTTEPLLYITTRADALGTLGRFAKVESLGVSTVALHKDDVRTLYLFDVSEPMSKQPSR